MNTRTRGVLVTAAGSPLTHAIVAGLMASDVVRSVIAVQQVGEALPEQQVPGVHYVTADLTRRRDVHNLLQGIAMTAHVDTILHMNLHPDARDRGRRVFRLNVESTRHLLSVAEDVPHIKRFVLRSFHDLYRMEQDSPVLFDENQPLELSARTPQAARNHAEADLMVCAKMGVSRLQIAVLRCADVLAAGVSSQLYDYLSSKVCLRALGYDPMVNVLSLADAERALRLAALSDAVGIFNIPGKDSLPLSELIHRARRVELSLPGPLLTPLYALRTLATGLRFHYETDRQRFHHGCILDGGKARERLNYTPLVSVSFDMFRV